MLVCCGVRFLNNGICALISLSTKVFIEHFSVYVVLVEQHQTVSWKI